MRPVSIGVVLVNWNGPDDTITCLESLARARPGPARVVVVDNASTDQSVERIGHWAEGRPEPRPRIVRSETNRGFAGGTNIGLAELAADPAITHFLLLNNDATVDPTFFAAVAAALAQAPDAALLGATIYAGTTRDRVWYAGGRLPGMRALTTHGVVIPDHSLVMPTEFVTGCTMLISRGAWETLGPLPECYFMYFEDAEYSLRARAAGLPVMYAPGALVQHADSHTVRRLVPRTRNEYWVTRARVLFVRRNFQGLARWRALAYLTFARSARAAQRLLTGRPRLAWATLRALAAGLLAVQDQLEVPKAGAVQRRRDGVVVEE
jgi:GT2 family glycosyltransferase